MLDERPGENLHQENTGLDGDLIYIIYGITNRIEGRSGLEPLPTVEEYLEQKKKEGWSPDLINDFKQRCRKEKIAEYNTLVKEFNSEIEEIKDDIPVLKEWINKFTMLVTGRNMNE
ncbi:MAG: hypothetical protein WCW25_01515 [Patescibacteria group bacterium]|jgi:hypothetical protein